MRAVRVRRVTAPLALGFLVVLSLGTAPGASAQHSTTELRGLDGPSEQLSRSRSLSVMGTDLVIRAYGDDAAQLDRAIDAAITEIRRVEDLATDWRDSPLLRLDAQAGRGPQPVEDELRALIGRALRMAAITGGAFDPTFAGVGRLWHFDGGEPRVPAAEDIAAALSTIDFTRVIVDDARGTIELPAGFRIGLGGIAKGYGVDRAMQVLMEHGVQHAVVNAGGDMKLLGRRDGELWEVAIKHPRDRASAMAVLHLSNACVVTSGDYERFLEIDGRRYHHILDPRTGYPSTGCMSATVVGPSAEDCDAFATALCVLGVEDGLALVEQLPRIEAILVGMDGAVHVSTGLRDVVPARTARETLKRP